MMDSVQLHSLHLKKTLLITNRLHSLMHSIAIASLIYFRVSSLFMTNNSTVDKPPMVPSLMVFASELLLSFIWLLGISFGWRPVARTTFLERLPNDEDLPGIDVFICTADPNMEPTVEVMNTVISAMALDYPSEKLHVYVSDDAGSSITLHSMREAWLFATSWLPFCKKYGNVVKTSSPQAYFSALESGHGDDEFLEEKKKIKEKYELFKMRVMKVACNIENNSTSTTSAKDHPAAFQVLGDEFIESAAIDQVRMPLLVYVAREKKPSHPHHFKAGALNALLRISAVTSNSPYILVLDCDMYCNDPSSARRAMCFHLDPKISPTLAFVQFPQRFHNVGEYDLYDGHLRKTFKVLMPALDGLQGPTLCGTCFYIKRKALFGNVNQQEINLSELKNHFGASNKFIESLRNHDHGDSSNYSEDSSDALQQEMQLMVSTLYEKSTKWGEKVGFLYTSVVEDLFTGFMLHCRGWTSVYCNPSTPQFLGSSPTCLDILLVQWTRWICGLLDVGLSRFCPLVYGPPRMSILMSFAYAYVSTFPLCFCVPLWCFATVSQLSLFYGISLLPKASSYSFTIFAFIFLSSLLAHLIEVLLTGGSIQTWIYEQRLWMMSTVTSHLYGCLEAIMKKVGMREANFVLTNKAFDSEQVKLYQSGVIDFRTSNMLLVPLVTLTNLNMISFLGGLARVTVTGNWEDMFGQLCLSFYILVMSYPVIEGMLVRKDKGRIPPSISQISTLYSLIFLVLGQVILMY